MPATPFKILDIADAGKDKFNELLHARKLLKKVPPLRTHGDKWYSFDRKAWRLTEREFFRSKAMDILPERHRLARHAKAVMEHVEWSQQLGSEEQLYGAVKLDEAGRVLLNVDNGVLRISKQDVELLPHKEDYLFSGALSARWDDKAQCPLFHQVLEQALPDRKDQDLLHWFSGYLLFPDAKQHEVYLLCFGEGGTGKSTLAEAIIETVGREPLVTALSMAQICAEGQGAYSLPALQHALVNLGTELDTVEMGDSANFKRIVSGEMIEVRTIYGRPFPMRTTAKLWFNSNSLPRFKHGTEAELRRTRFLHFDQKPKDVDVTLKERLAAERDGVLVWMVSGLMEVISGKGAPDGGEKSRAMKEKFAISNDAVTAFVRQCCVFDPAAEIAKDDLYAEFGSFMDGHGFGEKSKTHLFRQFYERFPQVTVFRVRAGNAVSKKEGRYLRGIRLRDDD